MPTHTQSVLFDRSQWDAESALEWLITHGYKSKKIDVTDRYMRFRQRNPDYMRYHYRTMDLNNGVLLIIGFGNKKKIK